MPKFKVVLPGTPPEPSMERERRALAKVDAELVSIPYGNEEELIAATRDADGLLVSSAKITRRVIEAMKRCKVIARYGVGVDNVDLQAATDHGIVVANVPDFCMQEVSNHAIMLLLASAKKLVRLDSAVRDGNWARRSELQGSTPQIAGETLGLVAFGKIAKAVAPKAKALRLKVLAYDPYLDDAVFEEHGVLRVEFDDLLSRSDYVSVHTPLTDETRGMFGEREFRLMKPTAYFINTSRGPVVNEAALVTALREGWIAGAGLDVFEQEPVRADNPLLSLPNVTLTAHTASYSDPAFASLYRRTAEEASNSEFGLEAKGEGCNE